MELEENNVKATGIVRRIDDLSILGYGLIE